MKAIIRAFGTLVLGLHFVIATLVAIILAYTLVEDAIGSRGNFHNFEARIRHYTDRVMTTEDGSLQIISAHPNARSTLAQPADQRFMSCRVVRELGALALGIRALDDHDDGSIADVPSGIGNL